MVARIIDQTELGKIQRIFAKRCIQRGGGGYSWIMDIDIFHPQSGAFDPALHLASFDQVWNTIKKTHWEPEKTGVAWDEARDKYRPIVESAKSVEEVRQALQDLLGTLEQSHFGIIPRDEYERVNEEKGQGGAGTAGLEVRLLDDQLVVTRVFEGLPAAAAGVKPGWIVKLIGKRTADQIIKGAEKVAEHSVVRHQTAVGLVCDSHTSGDPGSRLAFAFIDHEDQVRDAPAGVQLVERAELVLMMRGWVEWWSRWGWRGGRFFSFAATFLVRVPCFFFLPFAPFSDVVRA